MANTLSSVRTLDETLQLKQAQQKMLEQAAATAEVLFSAGKASYLEVLLAQQNSLQAELAVIEARRLRWLANLGVFKAVGGGWR